MLRAPLVLSAIVTTFLAAAPAHAGDLARARALFDEAGELERHGDWHAAAERLREALRIRETPHLHFALGWALEHEALFDEARREYARAVELARGREGAEEVLALAGTRLTELGEAETPRPAPTRVAPPAARPPKAPEPRARVLPWVLVGVGGALGVAGVAVLGSSLSDARSRDDQMRAWCTLTACAGGREATLPETTEATALRAGAERAADRGNDKQVVAAVLGGAAVATAALGVVLLLRRDEAAAPSPRIDAFGGLVPGGFAGGATVRF